MWLKKLFGSFRYAWAGIVRAVKTQRNFRVHLAAVCYAHWAGVLADLSRGELALITLSCGLVLGLELVNTALEALCDKVTGEFDPLIEAAKDAAAGAVLLGAIAAVGVALWLIGPWVVSGGLRQVCISSPAVPIVFLISLIPAGLFIRWDGK